MKVVPFEKLYNTDFVISKPMAKPQFWSQRGNIYNAMGKPKPSHTLLWCKNCSAVVTDSNGVVIEFKKNQLAYMAKGIEYKVEFRDTNPDKEDTIVIHFQMTDCDGNDIAPTLTPTVCIKNVESSFAMAIEMMTEEFRNNVVCIPKITATIYKILAVICESQKKKKTKNKYTIIQSGIELLEQDSNMSISEIAARCGVSECYFRKLFREYSGESPMDFRQHHRIEKAKLLLTDEYYTVGDIANELHFSDIYHFSKTFKKYCGVSPNQFLRSEGSKID